MLTNENLEIANELLRHIAAAAASGEALALGPQAVKNLQVLISDLLQRTDAQQDEPSESLGLFTLMRRKVDELEAQSNIVVERYTEKPPADIEIFTLTNEGLIGGDGYLGKRRPDDEYVRLADYKKLLSGEPSGKRAECGCPLTEGGWPVHDSSKCLSLKSADPSVSIEWHGPSAPQIKTVGGLEQFVGHKYNKSGIDTAPEVLLPCPFCGHEAGFKEGPRHTDDRGFNISVWCYNGACSVHTPEHYKDRESAAVAWNRRDPNAAPHKR